jgi:hypothetical protein
MKKIRSFTVGSLVGMALIAGIAGTASAAPASTATTGVSVPSTTTSSAPPTSSPFSSSPATTVPATTAPPTSTPSPSNSSGQTEKSKKAKKVMTGAEIWRIVSGHRTISCSHATKELKRVRSADAAVSQRLARWSTRSGTAEKSTAKNAKAMASQTGKKVKFFRKLEKKGTGLIKRIEAQCGAKSTTN